MRLLAASVVLALAAASPALAAPRTPPANPWASPNLLVDADRLAEIAQRRNGGDPVISAAWDQCVQEAQSRLSDTPNPVHGALKIPGFYVNPTAQQAIARPLRADAVSAYSFAMAYALTQDPSFATKAKEFVFAWVNNCTHPVDGGQPWQILTWDQRGDTPLVIEYTFPQFCGAIDLLEGTGGISAPELAQFRAWLRVFVNYCALPELSINNHVDWQVVFLMSAAQALGDPALFDQAVSIYRDAFQFQVWGTGQLPFELLRGQKSATYSLMAIEAMEQACFFAEMHGYQGLRQMNSLWGGDLRDAVGYMVEFLENPSTWHNGTKLDAPSGPGAWGWFLEVADMWWDDVRYERQLTQRPYGVCPERCYTMSYATLDFAP
jgi:hypothetical protein